MRIVIYKFCNGKKYILLSISELNKFNLGRKGKSNMKRFIDLHVPITSCNLKCHYCYVTQMNKNNSEKVEFKYSPEHVRKALSVKRLGGICLFNVCGLGETLIPFEVLDYIKELLKEGHYIMIVTNGLLTNRFIEIEKFDKELRKRLFFKFSFHYLELKRTNQMDVFFENVKRMQKADCSFTIEITPSDELEEHIEDIKKIMDDKMGVLCHVTIPRKESDKDIPILSKHNIEEFYSIWSTFNSELLDFKKQIWGVKRKEFCHAGEWSGLLNLGTGIFTPCYCIKGQKKNIFENIDKKIEFYPVGYGCKMPHCYNGHSFLALGNVPEINKYHYNQIRDRVDKQGKHWLNEETNKFYNTRLEDENKTTYSLGEKLTFKRYKYKTIFKNVMKKVLNKE